MRMLIFCLSLLMDSGSIPSRFRLSILDFRIPGVTAMNRRIWRVVRDEKAAARSWKESTLNVPPDLLALSMAHSLTLRFIIERLNVPVSKLRSKGCIRNG